MKNRFFKIVFIAVGLALLSFGLSRFAVTFCGKTTTAEVSWVSVNHDWDSEDGSKTIVFTYYSFEVNGKTYGGSGEETLYEDRSDVTSEEFAAARENLKTVEIRYLSFFPKYNNLNLDSSPSFGNIALSAFITVLGVVFVICGIMIKPAATDSDSDKHELKNDTPLSELSTKYIKFIDTPVDTGGGKGEDQ